MRRRRLVRKRFLTGCFIMLLFVAILTGRSMLTSMAEEEPMTVSPYYKSVEIKDGVICGISPDSTKREAVCLQKNTSGN